MQITIQDMSAIKELTEKCEQGWSFWLMYLSWSSFEKKEEILNRSIRRQKFGDTYSVKFKVHVITVGIFFSLYHQLEEILNQIACKDIPSS